MTHRKTDLRPTQRDNSSFWEVEARSLFTTMCAAIRLPDIFTTDNPLVVFRPHTPAVRPVERRPGPGEIHGRPGGRYRQVPSTQAASLYSLHNLQHRRDVAGLATLYKVQEQRVPHVQELRLPPRRAEVLTRTVSAAPSVLTTAWSHSTHHQRQFKQNYVQWWNKFLALDKCPEDLSVLVWGGQKFKKC
ncbi:hypothetical protein E2C01_016048 [Portunus trituberculatus]|uniref:Uncharacterized protein n=1 Tax=Portunus trituberculatus TaxID=210409 RepID=A0A5B7DPQ4_PORTR|nr:hypothetical protein [Portunus trituberculatus]